MDRTWIPTTHISVLLINKGAPAPLPVLIEKPHYFRGPRCQKEISIVNDVHGTPIGVQAKSI